MGKYKKICEIALTEINNIDDLGDIADTVIRKLIQWTYAEKMWQERALTELSYLAEWLSDYKREGEE